MAKIALLLQGGGALGAYELGALRSLHERGRLPAALVSGVSIGAVNATVLVGARDADPLAALATLWRKLTVPTIPFAPQRVEQSLAWFGNPHLSRLRYDVWNMPQWTAMYSPEPLRELLDELVDFDKLNAAETIVQLGAVCVETGEVEIFSNQDGRRITIDQVLASLSIPPMFPAVAIDGRHYWDGGLFDHAPLGAMIDALPAGLDARLVVVNLVPLAGRVPANMAQVQDRLLEIVFSNRILGDLRRLSDYNAFAELAGALDQALPENSPIRSLPGFRHLERLRAFKDPTVISQGRDEDLGATLDFSARSIESRIAAGYRDAERALAATRD